ncbi:hypothetical protein GobsT_11370 [Gemmata obscuriglobus]|uniref:hypothetical protein n=1 Tax=Gemmata obscuriglobus TaxID=114 RepID=UPI00016C3522|nr:hypothetical protein [Gemmata obscuriglobus]QEG26398.1 hypothetical protein GobsT_11370 [Gemmata obscuriglobus]VTS01483.1 unnamed protein product [Gemmata obscuriglobus UQM 2246]
MATQDDPLARLIGARFRQHERGLISAEELGTLVVLELARVRAFHLVEEAVGRLPAAAAVAARRYAEEIAVPSWSVLPWGVGPAPTPKQHAEGLAALRRVAGQVLTVLIGTTPEAEPGAAPDTAA